MLVDLNMILMWSFAVCVELLCDVRDWTVQLKARFSGFSSSSSLCKLSSQIRRGNSRTVSFVHVIARDEESENDTAVR